MRSSWRNVLMGTALFAITVSTGAVAPEPGTMVMVGPGVLRPLYPPSLEETEIKIDGFLLDTTPVTNGQFLSFVQQHPRWRRDRVSRLFADQHYLSHWAAPETLGPSIGANQPVTNISWFAARAYCVSLGTRLATESEWELAATASDTEPDASNDPSFRARILQWYARPSSVGLADVASDKPNYWGVYDLHGLAWEWVEDFNSALVSADNREDGGADRLRFCGAGALAASNKEDYASFMRIAFRSSLEGHYTAASLGFRCARDHQGGVL